MLQENCYVVSDETHECVIVDCGAYYEEERRAVVDYIRDNQLVPRHLLATHGHVDHLFGDNTIYDTFGLEVELHADDEPWIMRFTQQAASVCRVQTDYDHPPVGRYFTANDTINFGSHTIYILETPGHSQGSVCFHIKDERTLFTGDTLFRGTIGRTDLEGGSMFQIIQSLRMLSQLPDDTVCLPGHGKQTTIGYEEETNPYMDR